MKRYYMSFKGFGFMTIFFSALCIANSILFFIINQEYVSFFWFVISFFWFVMSVVAIVQVYRIYSKKVYLEINEQHIYYKYIGKGTVFEYSDADFYTAKQAHGGFVIYYESLSEGKKKAISLNIFNVDFKEFLRLLSKYSTKAIFIKEYGEEQKLYENIPDVK